MALLSSLVIATLVMGLGAAYLRINMANGKRQTASVDRWRSFYVAEAGLSEAFMAVSQGRTGNIGSQAEPAAFSDGLCWVEAEEIGENKISLNSTGMVGHGRASLRLVLKRGTNPVAELGFFGDESVTIEPGAQVLGRDSDGYEDQEMVEVQVDGVGAGSGLVGGLPGGGSSPAGNSGNARGNSANAPGQLKKSGGSVPPGSGLVVPGGGPAPGDEVEMGILARVGSNGDIELQSSLSDYSAVEGNVTPGADGVAILDPGAMVSASTNPRTDKALLPEVPIPPLTKQPAHTQSSGRTLTLQDGDYAYERLEVGTGAQVDLVGPLRLVVGDLVVGIGAILQVDASNGPVAIYVEDSLEVRPRAQFLDVAGDAASVMLYVRGAETDPFGGIVQFEPTGTFVGQLLTPNADLRLPASLDVQGSVAARNLTLAAGTVVTFDHSVTRSSLGVQAMPESMGWSVVEFPEDTIFGDAVMLYRLQGVTPQPLDEAQREQDVRLTYVDNLGVVQVYDGPMNGLARADVVATVDVQWRDPTDASLIDNPGFQGLPSVPTMTASATTDKVREALSESKILSAAESAAMVARLGTNANDGMLMNAVRHDPPMKSNDLRDALVNNSPLSLAVYDAAMESPALTPGHKRQVHDAQ